MRHYFIACLAVTCLLSPVTTPPAHAEEATATIGAEVQVQQNIHIVQAYAFATMPGSETGAAFMVITNTGAEDDALVGVKTKVAKNSEIHENIIDPDDGKMMMRKIKSVIIPANGQAVLEPKGKHVMLLKLPAPLTLGESFPLTLNFEKAGEKVISVGIIQPGTKPGAGGVAAIPDPHVMDHHHKMEQLGEKVPPQLPVSSNNPVSLLPVPAPQTIPAPAIKIETEVSPSTVTTIDAKVTTEVETEIVPMHDIPHSHGTEAPAGEEYQRLENSEDVITDY